MFDLEQLMKELLNHEKNNPFTGICTISKYPDDIRLFDLAKMNSQDVDNAFKHLEEILKKKQENESKTIQQNKKCSTNAANKTVSNTCTSDSAMSSCTKSTANDTRKQSSYVSKPATSFDMQKQQLQEERKKLEEELELAKLRAENQRLRDQIKNFNKHL